MRSVVPRFRWRGDRWLYDVVVFWHPVGESDPPAVRRPAEWWMKVFGPQAFGWSAAFFRAAQRGDNDRVHVSAPAMR